MLRQRPTHIWRLETNNQPGGKDYIIGDVHGSKTAFEAVLNKLNPQDRLFIVGDLTDRGEDSAGIIRLIQERNQHKQQVYVVRGNHEDMFLQGVRAIQKLQDDEEFNEDDFSAIARQIANGGDWIFANEEQGKVIAKLTRRIIDLHKKLQIMMNQNKEALVRKIQELKERLINMIRREALIDEIDEIKAYMESLPYIIRVGEKKPDESPFIVCHADLPFSDEELDQKEALNPGEELNPEEIGYITWARKKDIPLNHHRNESSVRVYCGHSIVDGGHVQAVRAKTNTINLDGGAYYKEQFILINHTDKKAEIVCKSGIKPNDSLADELEAIDDHLNNRSFFEKHPWVKRALIGAAIGLAIVGVVAIIAATSGVGAVGVVGIGAIIGGHLGLKAGLAMGGAAIVAGFSFFSSAYYPVLDAIADGVNWISNKIFPPDQAEAKMREEEQGFNTGFIHRNLQANQGDVSQEAVEENEFEFETVREESEEESEVKVVNNNNYESTEYKRVSNIGK